MLYGQCKCQLAVLAVHSRMNFDGSIPDTEQLPGTHVTHGLSCGLSAVTDANGPSSIRLMAAMVAAIELVGSLTRAPVGRTIHCTLTSESMAVHVPRARRRLRAGWKPAGREPGSTFTPTDTQPTL